MTDFKLVPTNVDVPTIIKEELPEEWDACKRIITDNVSSILKKSTIVYWYTGKVIEHMSNIHGDGTVQTLADETGYSTRSLYYMQSVYTAFPEYSEIKALIDAQVTWTGLKDLARLPDEMREEAIKELSAGDIDSTDISEYVTTLLGAGDNPSEDTPPGDVDIDMNEGDEDDVDNSNEASARPFEDVEYDEDTVKPANTVGGDDDESVAAWMTKFCDLLKRIQKNQFVDIKDIKGKVKEITSGKLDTDEYRDATDSLGVALDEMHHIKDYVEAVIEVLEK